MKNWCIYHPKDNEVIEYLRKLKCKYNLGLECNLAYYYYLDNNELDSLYSLPTGYTLLTEQDFKEQIMNKKELPKYFVIKRNSSNPLWGKYIQWLNSKYNTNWQGNTLNYYGFDGISVCWYKVNSFNNNPILLTLEEWDSIVNPKEEFILPEKWCIAITLENQEVLNNWRINIKKFSTYPCQYPYLTEDGSGNSEIRGKEITFEQFKRHVLKQEMYTIEQIKEQRIAVVCNSKEEGQKLFKALHPNPFLHDFQNTLKFEVFLDGNSLEWEFCDPNFKYFEKERKYGNKASKTIEFNQVIFENMKQKEEIIGYIVPFDISIPNWKKGDIAITEKNQLEYWVDKNFGRLPKEIVETWEPVYKTKEQIYKLSNGKEVKITKDYVVCANENVKIEKFRELSQITSKLNNTFHTWSLSLTEATFKIGCYNDVKLSEIKEIIKIHEKL